MPATLTLDYECALFSFPATHSALSLLSSSSRRSAGSAFPARPCVDAVSFPFLTQSADLSWFSSSQRKTFHGINAISLKSCLQGCLWFVSSVQNKSLKKKQSNKAKKTLALERMKGQHGRKQLFGCKGIQHASVEQNQGSLMSTYHSFIISRALRSAVKKGA